MKREDDVDTKSGIEEKRQAEANAEKLGNDQEGGDPRAAFISDTVRTIALLAHERLRLPPLLTPAVRITRELNVCNHVCLPVDGRLARLLVRNNAISVRILYCW